MDNATEEAKKNNLTVGKPLTKEQITKLDKDIVWYEYQEVDGIQVLAPKVYLSQNTLKNLNTDTRSRITGLENKATIKGDVNLVGSNLVLGDNSFVAGKLTTDSRELHNSYSLEEKKKGFSGSIGSGGFSVGYGKSESKLKEKDLTNAKSNLVLGDGITLNKGADITATQMQE